MPKKPHEVLKSTAVYIFQGDDDLAIQDALSTLNGQFQEGGWGDMNIIKLNGGAASHGAVSNAINMLPLGGGKRLVILRDALDFMANKESKTFLLQSMAEAPQTTVLVLIFEDSKKYFQGNMVWQKVKGNHWLKRAVEELDRETQWLEFALPSIREMPGWIMQEAKNQNGVFEGSAAAELARLVGDNTLQARHEITKALSYAGPGNPVTQENVRILCPPSTEARIFTLVDAVGKRDARSAMSLLRRLLTDLPIQRIFSMVARQIRQLIIAKETLAAGGKDREIQSAAGVHTFVAKKLMGQSKHFQMTELERIYRQLDRMDEASKTGQGMLEVGLESLFTELSRD